MGWDVKFCGKIPLHMDVLLRFAVPDHQASDRASFTSISSFVIPDNDLGAALGISSAPSFISKSTLAVTFEPFSAITTTTFQWLYYSVLYVRSQYSFKSHYTSISKILRHASTNTAQNHYFLTVTRIPFDIFP